MSGQEEKITVPQDPGVQPMLSSSDAGEDLLVLQPIVIKNRWFWQRIKDWKAGRNQYGEKVTENPRSWFYVAWRFFVKYALGKFGAVFYGVGCAATIGYLSYLALGALFALTGPVAFGIAAFIFVSGFLVNLENNWRGTPKLLKQLLVTGIKDWQHSKALWIGLIFGIVVCALTALAICALTWGASVPAFAAILTPLGSYSFVGAVVIAGLAVAATAICEFCMPLNVILNSFVKHGVWGSMAKAGRFTWNTLMPIGISLGNIFLQAPANLVRWICGQPSQWWEIKEGDFWLEKEGEIKGKKVSFYVRADQIEILEARLNHELDVFKPVKRIINEPSESDLKDCDGNDIVRVTFEIARLEDVRHVRRKSQTFYSDNMYQYEIKSSGQIVKSAILPFLMIPVVFIGVITMVLANKIPLYQIVPKTLAWAAIVGNILSNLPFYLEKMILTINELCGVIQRRWQQATGTLEKTIVVREKVSQIGNATGNGAVSFAGAGGSFSAFSIVSLICGFFNSVIYGTIEARDETFVKRESTSLFSCRFFGKSGYQPLPQTEKEAVIADAKKLD